MRALVTGGAGFIGSHTADLLIARGDEVRILDSLQRRVHPRGRPAYLPREAEFIAGDAACPDDLARALDGVDVVFHLAAYQDYLTDFSTFIRVNTGSTALLLELIVARRLPVRKVVFASSQAVAGEGVYRCREHGVLRPGPRPLAQLERGRWDLFCPTCEAPLEPQLIDEGTANPHTAYAISKYAIELLAQRLGRRYGIPSACMRYTYVQGPRNSFYNAYSGICRIFVMRVLHGLPPVLYEDGRQLRDYVGVRDVAAANVLVAEREESDFEVYNVGGGHGVTVREFAGIVLQVTGSDLQPEIPGEFRVGDTRHTVSNIGKLRRLGWEPRVPVEENVREYVEWLRTQEHSAEFLREADRLLHAQRVVRRAAVPNAA